MHCADFFFITLCPFNMFATHLDIYLCNFKLSPLCTIVHDQNRHTSMKLIWDNEHCLKNKLKIKCQSCESGIKCFGLIEINERCGKLFALRRISQPLAVQFAFQSSLFAVMTWQADYTVKSFALLSYCTVCNSQPWYFHDASCGVETKPPNRMLFIRNVWKQG